MGGDLVNPGSPPSYTEIFERQFPFYLSIGMTYDQYWNDDCLLVKYYRKAHELAKERRNQELWLQGLYIYDALCCVAPILHSMAKRGTKPLPYPEKPYPITPEAIKQEKEERARANRLKAKAMFEAWASKLDLPEGVRDDE